MHARSQRTNTLRLTSSLRSNSNNACNWNLNSWWTITHPISLFRRPLEAIMRGLLTGHLCPTFTWTNQSTRVLNWVGGRKNQLVRPPSPSWLRKDHRQYRSGGTTTESLETGKFFTVTSMILAERSTSLKSRGLTCASFSSCSLTSRSPKRTCSKGSPRNSQWN